MCRHCKRRKEAHWADADGNYWCAARDLPNYTLFGNIVSTVQFEEVGEELVTA